MPVLRSIHRNGLSVKWGQIFILDKSPPRQRLHSSPPQRRRASPPEAGKPSIYWQSPWKLILINQCTRVFCNKKGVCSWLCLDRFRSPSSQIGMEESDMAIVRKLVKKKGRRLHSWQTIKISQECRPHPCIHKSPSVRETQWCKKVAILATQVVL